MSTLESLAEGAALIAKLIFFVGLSVAFVFIYIVLIRESLSPEKSDEGENQSNPGNDITSPKITEPCPDFKLIFGFGALSRLNVIKNSSSELHVRLIPHRTFALLEEQAPKISFEEFTKAVGIWHCSISDGAMSVQQKIVEVDRL